MKILVIRLSALGDILLTTGPLKVLRDHCPELEVHLLTSETGAEIFRVSNLVDSIHILKKDIGLISLIKFYRQLEDYDFIIDLQAKPKTSLLEFISASPFFQIKKHSRERRAFVKKRKHKERLQQHVVQKYYNTIREVFINLPEMNLEKLRPNLIVKGLTYDSKDLDFSKSIVIHPYASQKNKVWPHVSQLIEELHKENFNTIIIGHSNDHLDISNASLNLTNKTTLSEMSSIIASSKALVSTDSGPMHMGVALNKPTLALFGPTTKEFGFYPNFNKTAVIEDNSLNCRPCHVHGGNSCPLAHHKCMKNIEVTQILTSLKNIL